MTFRTLAFATTLALSLAAALPAQAQGPCGSWRDGLFPPATLDGEVRALLVFDDGAGPALVAGGDFLVAGGSASHVARWNGASWSALGAGLDGSVRALAAFDDGGGAQLVAAGAFTGGVARFDGAAWSTLGGGLDGLASALAVFDEGSGPRLFAAGAFTGGIARLDSGAWSLAGTGLDDGEGFALATFDDGAGQALFAGGSFTSASGTAASRIARWNGSAWAALDTGVDGDVRALLPHDDGNGLALFATGDFTSAGGASANGIARWNGAAWSALASGFDDGGGRSLGTFGVLLHAGGTFTSASGTAASRIARWNGSDWSSLGHGVDGPVDALAAFDDGIASLFVGGAFATAGGSATSPLAAWRLRAPVTIDMNPAGASVCDGDSATFTVAASGSPSLSYQWRHDGDDIAGANGDSLTIVGVTAADAGAYDVVVGNVCGTATSSAATLVVRLAPAIDVAPADATACEEAEIALAVTASGAAPLAYQWRYDGSDVPGANAASLVIASATTADAGAYDVVVSNTCGMATSAAAQVTVHRAPRVVTPPSGASACEGDPITLSVVANGAAPLAFQWQRNGADVPGAIADTLSIPHVTAADAGSYRAIVTNACGSATSAAASVVVFLPPSIVAQPTDRSICESGAVAFSVVASGAAPLSYQWRKDGVPISGATQSSLAVNPVLVADAGAYDVVVTNVCGMTTSRAAILFVRVAPTVTSSPVSRDVCAGQPVTLSVTATGSGVLRYQWRRNGTFVLGAQSASYSISSATVAHSGVYDCLVGNGCGVVSSATATLTVTPLSIVTFAVDPTIVTGGDAAAGSVTISCPAPAGGVSIALQSSAPAIASPPAAVVVPEGATSAPFAVATSAPAATTDITITATGAGASATLRVLKAGSECIDGAGAEAFYFFDAGTGAGQIDMSATRTFDVVFADLDGSRLGSNANFFLAVEDAGVGSGDESLATRVRWNFDGPGGHLLESDDLGLVPRSAHAFLEGQVPRTFDLLVRLAQDATGPWTVSPMYRLPGGAATPFDGGASWTTQSAFDLTQTRLAVRIDAGASGRLCFTPPTVTPPACFAGNVNSGVGPTRDLLRLNGSTGGPARQVRVAPNARVTLSLDAAPAGSGAGEYVVWVWFGSPKPPSGDLVVDGTTIGCVVDPTPFHVGETPLARYCLRGGAPPEFCAGLHEFVGAPTRAPFSVRRNRGIPMPMNVVVQGVIHDAGAGNVEQFSITNAIVLLVR